MPTLPQGSRQIQLFNKYEIISYKNLALIIITEFILITLMIFIFTAICNTATLILPKTSVMLCTVITYLISLAITLVITTTLLSLIIKFMPISNAMIRWHNLEYLPKKLDYIMIENIKKISLSWSLGYLMVLSIIVIISGIKIINKMDIIHIDEEEVH
jgi:hypothetical protein